ncbi:hypothetical protein E3T43_01125 [Cryobacterium sp. Hh7]|uniref:hypothetical protein n=1 Tax=Cryobacterium sp. Hh7 TaxID=1259159 RepID=UPI0010695616|nr:hypothetical protein [Cryobacterium sp. Hh7]TFD61102.1 hypothetical protein E3T43_01125 [Cryobacterium sp. Hh7]
MTDHKAVAEDLTAYHDARIGGDWTPVNDSEVFALAQVHATLALADATRAQTEQLRLANVIAWTTQAGRMPSPETRDAVAKGLGL